MSTHPLFAGFAKSDLIRNGAALGFDVRVITSQSPFFPMNLVAAELIRTRLGCSGEGFYRIARWHLPGVYCVAYAQPLTAFAMACYLAGLGQIAQDSHKTRGLFYRYSLPGSVGLQGWSDHRNGAAESGEREALSQGHRTFRTHAVAPPLASSIYTGASVLEDLRLAAYEAVGDESRDWPHVTPDQTGVFCEAQALLIDGFAWHTENTPDFSVTVSSATVHEVQLSPAVFS